MWVAVGVAFWDGDRGLFRWGSGQIHGHLTPQLCGMRIFSIISFPQTRSIVVGVWGEFGPVLRVIVPEGRSGLRSVSIMVSTSFCPSGS